MSGSQEPGKSETARRLTPGPLKYDHFEVEVGVDGFPIELGSGAIAITYRARDTVLNSVVALKVIDRKVAKMPGVRSRFLREARAAAQIRHPNVARVSHYGEQDGECFYVMELVEGETLEAQSSPRRSDAARAGARSNRTNGARIGRRGNVRRCASGHQAIEYHAGVGSRRLRADC